MNLRKFMMLKQIWVVFFSLKFKMKKDVIDDTILKPETFKVGSDTLMNSRQCI